MMAYALNIADLALTLYALRIGAQELNPLMQSVPVMVAYKVIVVGGLCWWLERATDTNVGSKTRLPTKGGKTYV